MYDYVFSPTVAFAHPSSLIVASIISLLMLLGPMMIAGIALYLHVRKERRYGLPVTGGTTEVGGELAYLPHAIPTLDRSPEEDQEERRAA
jgi:hypothetical protein